jgi:hypothetical protein
MRALVQRHVGAALNVRGAFARIIDGRPSTVMRM